MSRALLASVGLSAAAHVAAVAAFPWAASSGRGLGFNVDFSPAIPRPDCPVRLIFVTETPSFHPPSPPEADLPVPRDLPGPAGEAPPPEEGLDPEAAREMLEVHVPPVPPRDPPSEALALTRLVLQLPPRPKPEKLAIRVEDVRWNRLVASSIGASSRLSPELASVGLHGTVRLMLYLTPEGRIRDLRVVDAGPYAALAMAAQAQVRAAEPFPRPPEGMDDRLLRIPLNLHY